MDDACVNDKLLCVKIAAFLSRQNCPGTQSLLQTTLNTMAALQTLLNAYRVASQTHREKGTYFENLICTYLRHEASYKDLYSQVCAYADWAREQNLDARDTGTDLVAKTAGTDEYHPTQILCRRLPDAKKRY
jgi:hypothetical protein